MVPTVRQTSSRQGRHGETQQQLRFPEAMLPAYAGRQTFQRATTFTELFYQESSHAPSFLFACFTTARCALMCSRRPDNNGRVIGSARSRSNKTALAGRLGQLRRAHQSQFE